MQNNDLMVIVSLKYKMLCNETTLLYFLISSFIHAIDLLLLSTISNIVKFRPGNLG